MIEIFEDAKVETSEDTRKKAIAAFGFDEPPALEKLSRSDFGSDEEFYNAVAELSVRNNSPEYREAYRKIRREYTAQKKAEEEAAAEQKHQEEIAQAIKGCVLRPEEQQKVDNQAREMAQNDLAAGRISFQEMGAAVARYAEQLTAEAKERKVHTADINKRLRAAMSQVIRQG